MKNILISGLLLIGLTAHAQNILRVNNTPGVNAPYTTIPAAVTAAGVNDVILVEGSTFSYGDISVNKQVTLVGPGYFLDENTGLQVTLQPARLNSLQLSSGASGSTITGLTIERGLPFVESVYLISVGNLTFQHCNLTGDIKLFGSATNVIIRGNLLESILNGDSGSYTNILIVNNRLSGLSSGNSVFTAMNNTIYGGNLQVPGSNIRNNIFTISGALLPNFTGTTIKNNIFVFAQGGVDATNLIGQPLSSLFVGLAGNTTDTQWRLKAGSPAIGFGEGGIDCGMYGGATPYKPSGIATGQHTVNNLIVPATVIQNGTLNVKVSAKVN